MSAGAYGSTLSSNYNTRPRAAEVLVNGTAFALSGGARASKICCLQKCFERQRYAQFQQNAQFG